MAVEKVHIEQFLELAKQHPVLDVRSPGEYIHAHIPGAYSLPLFTDEERKIVGTAYKQQSREEAIKIGLDFFGMKMRKLVEEIELLVKNQESGVKPELEWSRLTTNDSRLILVHCWRGGMRSAGVAWLLDLYGFKVYTLIGGYKKFRNHVLETFKLPLLFHILGGYTGSGKTELLKTLKEKGEPVIDLECLANHKGSAFGSIGMPPQPGQEMFENLLSCELRAISCEQNTGSSKAPFKGLGAIWLEDESQRIGQVNIPHGLWKNMRESSVYFLDIPFEERLQHIVREYGQLNPEKLKDAITRISQKLGYLNAKTAILLLNEGKISETFDILLKYYDRLYFKSLHNREGINSLLRTVNCKSVIPENADQLILAQHQHPEKA
ncbi:MAG: tRNA 2-selenouridine(34) synthase MnmH [Bacteroidota bacterium]|nr:tRNA 2-selenouridine(34) synthase MnmH [Bacteroidota bacterium]